MSLICLYYRINVRFWRGYVGRSIYAYYLMLSKQLRLKKEKVIPNRIKPETFRRIWARKNFLPDGGWPGKADRIVYDMWEHHHQPPAGQGFGLKTNKVSKNIASYVAYSTLIQFLIF